MQRLQVAHGDRHRGYEAAQQGAAVVEVLRTGFVEGHIICVAYCDKALLIFRQHLINADTEAVRLQREAELHSGFAIGHAIM